MTAIDTGLLDLKRQHPEWEPWLAVVQEILSETTDPKWDDVVPVARRGTADKVPLLAGVTLVLEQEFGSPFVGAAGGNRSPQRDAADGHLETGATCRVGCFNSVQRLHVPG